MKKSLAICGVFLFIVALSLSAQDSPRNKKSLNFPSSKYGMSLGNSYDFSGVRINYADENVKRINGLNVTFWLKMSKNQSAVINGISVGGLPVAGTMGPVNLGVIGTGTSSELYGLTVGGLIIGCGGNISGLTVSGLLLVADNDSSVISGFTTSGIVIIAEKAINGFALGGFAVVTNGNINGVASSLTFISAKKRIQGLAITIGGVKSEIFSGLALAGITKTNQMNGLSFAIFNRTEELHGIQLGLINCAKNNRKWARVFPLINLHI